MTFPNVFRAVVEGLGSKRLTAMVAGVLAVFLAPVARKYLALEQGDLIPMLAGVIGLVVSFLFSQWHLDVKTGGTTSTSSLLAMKLAQAAEKSLPDGTKADAIAKAIVAALQEGAAEASGSAASTAAPEALPPPLPAPAK